MHEKCEYNNYTELTAQEVKERLLFVLTKVADYCESQGIHYFLTGGTLLGAVRHRGFIPWDDDVDIAMFRKDYERFIAEFTDPTGAVNVVSRHSKNSYRYAFAKAVDTSTILVEGNAEKFPLGVYVDIFPIDSLYDDKAQCCKAVRRMKRMQDLYALKYLKTSDKERSFWKTIVLKTCGRFLQLVPDKWILAVMDHANQSTRHNINSVYVANLCGAWGEKEITRRTNFASNVTVTFEGRDYSAPIGYDQFLHDIYNDYMQLPPEEKRNSHHHYKAYALK